MSPFDPHNTTSVKSYLSLTSEDPSKIGFTMIQAKVFYSRRASKI
jgi:hypothetical protein